MGPSHSVALLGIPGTSWCTANLVYSEEADGGGGGGGLLLKAKGRITNVKGLQASEGQSWGLEVTSQDWEWWVVNQGKILKRERPSHAWNKEGKWTG